MTDALVIAIVDDDDSVRQALQRLVRSAGYTVQTFASAEEFLGSLAQGHPACLILDIQLDGMSGFALQELLEADGVDVPVVFVTAHDDGPNRQRIERSTAAGHLWKPLDERELLDTIGRAIRVD